MTTQAFYNHVAAQDYDTLKPLWNTYAAETGYGEQIFASVEDVATALEFDAVRFAQMVFFGNLQSWWNDVFLNGYGNLNSCWDVESSPICVRELAQWLEDSNHEFYQDWESEQEEE